MRDLNSGVSYVSFPAAQTAILHAFPRPSAGSFVHVATDICPLTYMPEALLRKPSTLTCFYFSVKKQVPIPHLAQGFTRVASRLNSVAQKVEA